MLFFLSFGIRKNRNEFGDLITEVETKYWV